MTLLFLGVVSSKPFLLPCPPVISANHNFLCTVADQGLLLSRNPPLLPQRAPSCSLLCAVTQQGSWAQQLSATRAGPVTWAWSRADGGTDADRGTDVSGASQCFPAAVRGLWALLYSWQVRGGVGGDMQSPPTGMSGNKTGLSCCRADQRGWVPVGTEGSSLWVRSQHLLGVLWVLCRGLAPLVKQEVSFGSLWSFWGGCPVCPSLLWVRWGARACCTCAVL